MTPASRSPSRSALGALLLVLALTAASGCIRFTFWAGERELSIPPERDPTPTPSR